MLFPSYSTLAEFSNLPCHIMSVHAEVSCACLAVLSRGGKCMLVIVQAAASIFAAMPFQNTPFSLFRFLQIALSAFLLLLDL